MARGLFPVLLPLVLLALDGFPRAVQAQVRVCVEPADSVIALGESAVARVTVDGPPADLKGFLIRTTYASGVLSLGPISPGSVLSGHLATFIPIVEPPDVAGFDAAVLIGATRGPGVLGYIQYTGAAVGSSDLAIIEVILRDSFNQTYPVITCNGRIRVVAPTPAAPATWGRIKVLLRSQGE